MVSLTIQSGITEFENRRKLADEAFALRMLTLEKQVGNINQQVDAMATKLQNAIVQTLSAKDGIIYKQHSLIINQDKKLNQMAAVVGQLTTSIDSLLASNRARNDAHNPSDCNRIPVGSPFWKKGRTSTGPNDADSAATDPSTPYPNTYMAVLPPESTFANQQ
jgi:hypothetical protein